MIEPGQGGQKPLQERREKSPLELLDSFLERQNASVYPAEVIHWMRQHSGGVYSNPETDYPKAERDYKEKLLTEGKFDRQGVSLVGYLEEKRAWVSMGGAEPLDMRLKKDVYGHGVEAIMVLASEQLPHLAFRNHAPNFFLNGGDTPAFNRDNREDIHRFVDENLLKRNDTNHFLYNTQKLQGLPALGDMIVSWNDTSAVIKALANRRLINNKDKGRVFSFQNDDAEKEFENFLWLLTAIRKLSELKPAETQQPEELEKADPRKLDSMMHQLGFDWDEQNGYVRDDTMGNQREQVFDRLNGADIVKCVGVVTARMKTETAQTQEARQEKFTEMVAYLEREHLMPTQAELILAMKAQAQADPQFHPTPDSYDSVRDQLLARVFEYYKNKPEQVPYINLKLEAKEKAGKYLHPEQLPWEERETAEDHIAQVALMRLGMEYLTAEYQGLNGTYNFSDMCRTYFWAREIRQENYQNTALGNLDNRLAKYGYPQKHLDGFVRDQWNNTLNVLAVLDRYRDNAPANLHNSLHLLQFMRVLGTDKRTVGLFPQLNVRALDKALVDKGYVVDPQSNMYMLSTQRENQKAADALEADYVKQQAEKTIAEIDGVVQQRKQAEEKKLAEVERKLKDADALPTDVELISYIFNVEMMLPYEGMTIESLRKQFLLMYDPDRYIAQRKFFEILVKPISQYEFSSKLDIPEAQKVVQKKLLTIIAQRTVAQGVARFAESDQESIKKELDEFLQAFEVAVAVKAQNPPGDLSLENLVRKKIEMKGDNRVGNNFYLGYVCGALSFDTLRGVFHESRNFVQNRLFIFQALRAIALNQELQPLFGLQVKELDALMSQQGFIVQDDIYISDTKPAGERQIPTEEESRYRKLEPVRQLVGRLIQADLQPVLEQAVVLQKQWETERPVREVRGKIETIRKRLEEFGALALEYQRLINEEILILTDRLTKQKDKQAEKRWYKDSKLKKRWSRYFVIKDLTKKLKESQRKAKELEDQLDQYTDVKKDHNSALLWLKDDSNQRELTGARIELEARKQAQAPAAIASVTQAAVRLQKQ